MIHLEMITGDKLCSQKIAGEDETTLTFYRCGSCYPIDTLFMNLQDKAWDMIRSAILNDDETLMQTIQNSCLSNEVRIDKELAMFNKWPYTKATLFLKFDKTTKERIKFLHNSVDVRNNFDFKFETLLCVKKCLENSENFTLLVEC